MCALAYAGRVTEQTFFRGGYPLSGDPTMGRAMHNGQDRPRCTVCGVGIFGDEEYMPNKCSMDAQGQHTYPNGEKTPVSIYRHPQVPDGHIVFHGMGLVSPTGFRTGPRDLSMDMVHAIAGYPQDADGVDFLADAAADLWAENVVRPIVLTYLLPLVPFDHTLGEFETGNPIRITHIGTRDVRKVGEYEQANLLTDLHVSFPQAALVNLANHYQRAEETGVPDEVALPAYMAGLSVTEVRARYADGSLTPEAVQVLLALQD